MNDQRREYMRNYMREYDKRPDRKAKHAEWTKAYFSIPKNRAARRLYQKLNRAGLSPELIKAEVSRFREMAQ